MVDLSNLTPLTHKEAIEALKNGEELVNGIESYDEAFYHNYQGNILKSNNYNDQEDEGVSINEDDLPQLYRIGEGKFGSEPLLIETWNNADVKLREIIIQLLDTGNYPKSINKFRYNGLKILAVNMANLQQSPYTKKMIETYLAGLEEPEPIVDIPMENDENYISTSFKKYGLISTTTYWKSKLCKEGCPYLVHNLGTYSLLLPEGMDLDDGNALNIYITRGTYQGKKDCFEIVFDNGSENPLRIFLHHSQLLVLSDMELGWKGQLYIYSSWSKLDMFYYSFKEVCYRETDTLPSTLPLPACQLGFGQ
jgi:hypothetical protein